MSSQTIPSAAMRPTITQLFGTDPAGEQFIKILPLHIQFPSPIRLRLDIGRTKRAAMKIVHEYDRQLRLKYPVLEGSRTNREYTRRRLNSGTLATFDAMLEMYSGYLNAAREGVQVGKFSVSPSGIASRRYKAVRSMNTIGNHLDRLEGAGLFSMNYNAKLQKYNIVWKLELLVALPDKSYRDFLAKLILEKSPDAVQNEEFARWAKGLNPSFFACPPEGSPHFLSMYLLSQQEQNNNIPSAVSNMRGKTEFSHRTPFPQQEQGNSNAGGMGDASIPAAENSKSPAVNAHAISGRSAQIRDLWLKKKCEKQFKKEPDNGALDFFLERAFMLVVGILDIWWVEKIRNQTITANQVQTAKHFLKYWLVQDSKARRMDYRQYIDKILVPVLRMQRGSLLKFNYGWIPYIDKYFDPQWCCNDGSPAGYKKAVMKYEELKEKEKSRNFQKGSRQKMKKMKQREEVFSKEFFSLVRKPSENTYIKSEERIRALKDPELISIFIKSVKSAKLLPDKITQERALENKC